MEEKGRKRRGILALLRDPVQLRFYRSENFEQIGSFELSPRSIYIFLSSLILILLIFVFALFAYTPLQRLIPRLSSIENSRKFVELSNTLDDIETSINYQEVYMSALRTMLTGAEISDIANIDIPKMCVLKSKIRKVHVCANPGTVISYVGIRFHI